MSMLDKEKMDEIIDQVTEERGKALKSLESGKLNKGMTTINRKKFDMFDNILRLLCELHDYRNLGNFEDIVDVLQMNHEEKSKGDGIVRKCPWCGKKMVVFDKRSYRFCKFCGKHVKH